MTVSRGGNRMHLKLPEVMTLINIVTGSGLECLASTSYQGIWFGKSDTLDAWEYCTDTHTRIYITPTHTHTHTDTHAHTHIVMVIYTNLLHQDDRNKSQLDSFDFLG